MLKKILLGLLAVFLLIQLVRPARNNGQAATTNDITHTVPVPDTVLKLLQTSCYDCHSNHTNYPWYARISPVSIWLGNHVTEGKHELNFSEARTYTAKKLRHKLVEIEEQVEQEEMPLKSYVLIHGDARLTKAQAALIIAWANTSKTALDSLK